MRTFEEIDAAIDVAIRTNDHAALFSLADELSGIETERAALTAAHIRARAYRLSGAFPEALEQFQKLLALYEGANDRVRIASATLGIGIVHYLMGSYDEALINYNRSLQLNKELGLRGGASAALGNIGALYQVLGCYPEALDTYMKALDIHTDMNDRSGLGNDHCNIGTLYSAIGSYTNALEYLRRALPIFEEIGDHDGLAKAHHNLAITLLESGDLDAPAQHFEASLLLNREYGYVTNQSHVTGNYIDYLIRTGDLAAASALQEQHASMSLSVPSVHAGHYINKAHLLRHQGDLADAKESFLRALQIAVAAGIREAEAKIRKHLRDLALASNDLPGYVEHNNEYTRITEEINGKDTTARLAIREAEQRIAHERQEHEKQLAVLHSTLPKHIADRVSRGEQVNDHYDNAAVIFLDIVGFTSLSDQLASDDVVKLLGSVFTSLDAVCKKHDVVKIKTIGDSYMAVAFPSTIPHSVRSDSTPVPHSVRNDSSHLSSAASAALEMLDAISRIQSPASSPASSPESSPEGSPLQVRIGVHCGPITAGVIGTERLQYDVWGDTVNVASRMESTGLPGRIHVSETFANALNRERAKQRKSERADVIPSNSEEGEIAKERKGETAVIPSDSDDWSASSQFPIPCSLRERGAIEIKGKGLMTTFWLESEA